MSDPSASNHQPFISIVLPTRNRSHLLGYSLRSALNQEFDDYEIVVSDNDSSDETPKVVQELAHPRLRYVRTTKSLSMPDHWEFALDHARGQFIHYLCDDDALTPRALSSAAAALKEHSAKLAALGTARYSGATSSEVRARNSLIVPRKHQGLMWKQSRDVLAAMARCRLSQDFPLLLNSFCDRDILLQVRKEAGRIFMLAPDYDFALLIQTAIPSWLYLDKPLRLAGEFAESVGTTTLRNRGKAAQVFLEEFGDQSHFTRSPIDTYLMSNLVANAFLLCKHRHKGLANFEIDWVSYFEGCWLDMAMLADHKVDVHEDRELFHRALAEQPQEIQAAVKSRIYSLGTRWRIYQGWQLPRFQFQKRIGYWLANLRYFPGDQYGFSNILEAANFLVTLQS